MTLSLAQFTTQTAYGDIPEDVRCLMRRSLLDTIGVAIIGASTENARIARCYATEYWGTADGKAGARMIADGRRVSPAGAAFAGAVTIDSIDAHDGYTLAKGHAGSAVLPALLAIFDERREYGTQPSGQDLMVGLALGYEISYRCGLAHHATLSDYHTSGAWTAVGVAAVGARLLGLDADGIRHAAGIAEFNGPRSQMMRCIEFPTMLRDGVGWGAPTGVSAAYMAALGFTGAPALTVEGDAAREYWSDLGERWEVMGTYHKPYPVCRWAHPSLEAIRDLMTQYGVSHRQIERIRICTFRYATELAGADPKNLDELNYALIYPAAIMAVRGAMGRDELSDEVLSDPCIRRVAQVTELVESRHYTKISTDRRWADVTLYLTDGRILESGPRAPRGDPDDPLSDTEISEKFHAFAEGLIDPARIAALEQACGGFDDLDQSDLAKLFDLIFASVNEAAPGGRQTRQAAMLP